MDAVPVEIWHNIFALACTDDGYTGRSLSLVSTYFHDISALFKYQSLVVTHWSQIIAFSKIFCQLPASQRKIKYLFVHHPYPFLDIQGHQITDTDQTSEQSQSEADVADCEGSEESNSESDLEDEKELLEDKSSSGPPETLDITPLEDTCDQSGLQNDSHSDSDSNWFADADSSWASHSDSERDTDFEGSLNSEEEWEVKDDALYLQRIRDGSIPPWRTYLDVFSQAREADDWMNRSVSGSDSPWNYHDSVWDSEFEGSLDAEEEREVLEDAYYLAAAYDKLLPPEGDTRDDTLRDAEIQMFFDNVLQAFHAILNETSSTLQILSVYWTSFKPLRIHELLPPLPCLEELHINQFSSLGDICEDPPVTVLFPRLLFLYTSDGTPRKLSFLADEIARIAPNLTHLRFTHRQWVTSNYLRQIKFSNVTGCSALHLSSKTPPRNIISTSTEVVLSLNALNTAPLSLITQLLSRNNGSERYLGMSRYLGLVTRLKVTIRRRSGKIIGPVESQEMMDLGGVVLIAPLNALSHQLRLSEPFNRTVCGIIDCVCRYAWTIFEIPFLSTVSTS